MKKSNNPIVVIRVSNMDGRDPIDEINKVIKEHGYCWFGKYGKPIAKRRIILDRKKSKAVLSHSGKHNGSGRCATQTFNIDDASDAGGRPPKDRVYPSYYKGKTGRVGTWLKLRPTAQIPIECLITCSSAMPVRHSLANSMAGFFYCRVVS